MTKRQLEKVRAKFENFDLSRYHILTYDEMLKVNSGTEVTVTQGDIDWAQDYCDVHGIGWSRSEETEKNDTAREDGQAEIAENQSELVNYDYDSGNSSSGNGAASDFVTSSRETEEETTGNSVSFSKSDGNNSISDESNKAILTESKQENSASRNEKTEYNFINTVINFFIGAKNLICDLIGIRESSNSPENISEETSVRDILEPIAQSKTGKKYEKGNTCDEFVANILTAGGKSLKEYHLENTNETVKQHIDDLIKDSLVPKSVPTGSVDVVFMGDGNKPYTINHEHAGLMFLGSDGSVNFYHSSKNNPDSLSIVEQYTSVKAFESDFAYDSFYYQEVR